MVAESPSPLPPPRSRARGDHTENASDFPATSSVTTVDKGETDKLLATALAEDVLGVVILLASEWVEVGSGLAEISMRADMWGDRLVALLFQVNSLA